MKHISITLREALEDFRMTVINRSIHKLNVRNVLFHDAIKNNRADDLINNHENRKDEQWQDVEKGWISKPQHAA